MARRPLPPRVEVRVEAARRPPTPWLALAVALAAALWWGPTLQTAFAGP